MKLSSRWIGRCDVDMDLVGVCVSLLATLVVLLLGARKATLASRLFVTILLSFLAVTIAFAILFPADKVVVDANAFLAAKLDQPLPTLVIFFLGVLFHRTHFILVGKVGFRGKGKKKRTASGASEEPTSTSSQQEEEQEEQPQQQQQQGGTAREQYYQVVKKPYRKLDAPPELERRGYGVRGRRFDNGETVIVEKRGDGAVERKRTLTRGIPPSRRRDDEDEDGDITIRSGTEVRITRGGSVQQGRRRWRRDSRGYNDNDFASGVEEEPPPPASDEVPQRESGGGEGDHGKRRGKEAESEPEKRGFILEPKMERNVYVGGAHSTASQAAEKAKSEESSDTTSETSSQEEFGQSEGASEQEGQEEVASTSEKDKKFSSSRDGSLPTGTTQQTSCCPTSHCEEQQQQQDPVGQAPPATAIQGRSPTTYFLNIRLQCPTPQNFPPNVRPPKPQSFYPAPALYYQMPPRSRGMPCPYHGYRRR